MANVKTGIQIRDSLKALFATATNEGGLRFIKAQLSDGVYRGLTLLNAIDAEAICEVHQQSPQGSWESDFALVPPVLEEKAPAFILYRTDDQRESRYTWYMLCYVPDTAPVCPLQLLLTLTKPRFAKRCCTQLPNTR